MQPSIPLIDPTEFTVGWISALPIELTAARCMLDEEYDDAQRLPKHHRDTNNYCLGRIGRHKVALTCLESAGNINAVSVAYQMTDTFTSLDFGLMVGIGGGIPIKDIRLGDVVVSKPSGKHSGVFQYDIGKFIQDGNFVPTGALKGPPSVLLKAVNKVISNQEMGRSRIMHHLQQMYKNYPSMAQVGPTDYRSPGKEHDQLYKAEYKHQAPSDTCANCDKNDGLVSRQDRAEAEPVAHYGNIASGNGVMRDAVRRDQLGRDHDALCVEMEAAGLMDVIPCLIIRGICDYADSHKNKGWQRYAAATAAAYAKALLDEVDVKGLSPAPGSFAPSSLLPSNILDDHFLAPHENITSTTPSTQPAPHFHEPTSRGSETSESPSIGRTMTPSLRTVSTESCLTPPSPTQDLRRPESSILHHPPPPHKQPTASQPGSSNSTTRLIPPAIEAWESRVGENILIKTQLMRYQSYGRRSHFPDRMSQSECRLFEFVDDRHGIPTRRIAVRSREDEKQVVSYWMPLDQVHVHIEDPEITIAFSDCAHIAESTKGYKTTFTYRYNRDKPNRRLVLECKYQSDIRPLVDALLYPSLERSHYDEVPIASEISGVGTIRLYKRLTDVNSSDAPDWNPDFAILMSYAPADSARYSQMYFGESSLDFQKAKAKNCLILNGMCCRDYTSKLEKPSKNDLLRRLDPEGRPDDMCTFLSVNYKGLEAADLEAADLEAADVMEALTGWRLLFCKRASAVALKVVHKLGGKRNLGGALVMVWKAEAKTNKDVQLLVRASSNGAEPPWLSVSMTSPRAKITQPEEKSTFIEAEACLRGRRISIYQMSVETSSNLAPKAYKIQLQFKEEEHNDEFYNTVKPHLQKPR